MSGGDRRADDPRESSKDSAYVGERVNIYWTDEDDREEEERVRAKESDLFEWAHWDAVYREWCAQPFGVRRGK